MEIRTAYLETEKEQIRNFLQTFGLAYDPDINYTVYAEESGEIIGTVSVAGTIIKAFAIAPLHQGEAVANILLSEIIRYFTEAKIYRYQVYTKPENRRIFESLHFREIITTDTVCLLETKTVDIREELQKLKEENGITGEDIGCLVVNCNPFTLGHQYLIGEAAKRHEHVIVFVLEEDRSFFSFRDRFHLVKAGTADWKNVKVLPSTPYLVSALTFPTYFLKKDVDQVTEQAKCDAMIFEKYFIPIFWIRMRYLGTETDPVTAKYNLALKAILKDRVTEIKRMESKAGVISASLVRAYLKTKEFDKIKQLVPETTLNFLVEHYG